MASSEPNGVVEDACNPDDQIVLAREDAQTVAALIVKINTVPLELFMSVVDAAEQAQREGKQVKWQRIRELSGPKIRETIRLRDELVAILTE